MLSILLFYLLATERMHVNKVFLASLCPYMHLVRLQAGYPWLINKSLVCEKVELNKNYAQSYTQHLDTYM